MIPKNQKSKGAIEKGKIEPNRINKRVFFISYFVKK
jgi:hypothetical protein